MARKNYESLIGNRIEFINSKLGTNYKTDYAKQYGGWNMYEVLNGGGHTRGKLGFDCRKSNVEMLAYVDGIYNLLCYYSVK